MKIRSIRLAALLGLGTLALATSSRATGRLPQRIQHDLALSYVPACSLCHVDARTGPGTARTPFALSAKARGLLPSDQSALDAALAQMKADDVDSDGDGVSDIDELVAGTDPNTPAATSLTDQPTAGCGGGNRRATGGSFGTTTFAMAIAFASRRKKRTTGQPTRDP